MSKRIDTDTKKYRRFFAEHHALMIKWARRVDGNPDSYYLKELRLLGKKYNYV